DLMDSTDFGESIRHVSAFAALAEYAESSPKNEMDYKMTGGNSRLVEEFVKRIGMESIRLSSHVRSVGQNSKGVHLKGFTVFPSPAGSHQQFAIPSPMTLTADAVICTVPIQSLLKIKFDPPLPIAQRNAAEQLVYS